MKKNSNEKEKPEMKTSIMRIPDGYEPAFYSSDKDIVYVSFVRKGMKNKLRPML